MIFRASFNPKGFLDTASKLYDICDTEADYRTIINRAYYACYAYLDYRFGAVGDTNNTSKHQRLINYLINNSNSTVVRIGTILELLFQNRKHADYYLNIARITKENAKKAIESAIELFDLMEDFEFDATWLNR